jgi:hypothetical protein
LLDLSKTLFEWLPPLGVKYLESLAYELFALPLPYLGDKNWPLPLYYSYVDHCLYSSFGDKTFN